jgi:hypothetical protein
MTNKAIRPNVIDVPPASREPLTEPLPGAQAYPEQISHPGRINKALPPRNEAPNSPRAAMWQDFHNPASGAALLAADTNAGYVHNASFAPTYWIVVIRGTAGYLNIHYSGSRGNHYVRLDKGTNVVRAGTNVITIETVGFSGFYDCYAAQSLDDFDILA